MLNWIKSIWDYNYWGHHKIFECVMELSEADFKQPVDYSVGSVHEQVVHVMWAEAFWYDRIHDQRHKTFTATDYPTRQSVRAKWDEVEGKWRDYINALTMDDLTKNYEFTRQNGKQYSKPLPETLIHVVNHGTDHRSQILHLLAGYGAPTFEQDMVFYFEGLEQ